MFRSLNKPIVALLLVVALALTGCSAVTVVPMGTGPGADKVGGSEAAGGPRHDLAVISLDFDPPLRLLQVDRAPANLALLVAVDNKGTYTERQVTVNVELRAQAGDEVLVRKQKTVNSIGPGQATVVKFGDFPSIPRRDGYTLAVRVEPVAGEANQVNNTTNMPLQLILAN